MFKQMGPDKNSTKTEETTSEEVVSPIASQPSSSPMGHGLFDACVTSP